MNRREFIRHTTMASAVAGCAHFSRAWALVPHAMERFGARSTVGQDERDRHSTTEPMTILRSTLVVSGLDVSALNEEYLDMLRVAGVNCWYKSIGGIQSFADTYSFLDSHKDAILLGTTVREIRQTHQRGKLALVLGWQSAELLGNTVEPPRTPLRAYFQLGLRVCGIAYNVANMLGAGNLEPHIGLTRAGRRVVEEIHQLGIVLDVGGHTGEQTSLDALEMSSGVPVICSHTNVAALNDNPRCISDRLIEAIARTGGVIGLTAVSDYMMRSRKDAHIARSPQAPLRKYLDQFDYLRRLIGVDHIGLGPDFIEGRSGYSSDASRNQLLFPPEMMGEWPFQYVKGFENIAELPNVVEGLLERGWSPSEMRKVLGENWLRVYEKVWGA